MDVVGSLGYQGQEIFFLDPDVYAYITGNCICLADVISGPKDLIWRSEGGIRKLALDLGQNRFAVIPLVATTPVEILTFPDLKSITALVNPSEATILDARFSRNGERLYGLSDVLDKKFFCWDVQSGGVLFVHDLAFSFTKFELNPADDGQGIYHSDSGIYFGTISEILGNFSFKVHSLAFEQATVGTLAHSDTVDTNDSVQFAIWAPFNRIIVGTQSRSIFDVEISTLTTKLLGMYRNPDSSRVHDEFSVPTCAALSADNLLVGTSCGSIFWIPLVSLATSSPTAFINPVQIAYVSGAVSSIAVDPKFEKIFSGSILGSITSLPIDVQERIKVSADGDEDQALDDPDKVVDSSAEGPMIIEGERLSTNQDGTVLATASLSIPIVGAAAGKLAKKTSNLASLFVTGSHTGALTFWKQPAVESDAIPVGSHGVHKSIPRTLKTAFTAVVADGALACVMSQLASGIRDGNGLLSIGSSTGWLEIWKMIAVECEDDEEEQAAGDEEGIRLTKSVIFRQRLYNGAFSLLAKVPETSDTKSDQGVFAVGSLFDHRIYILKRDQKDDFAVVNFVSIGMGESPAALAWTGLELWTSSRSGSVSIFSSVNASSLPVGSELPLTALVTSGFSSIVTGAYVQQKGMLAISGDSPRIFYFSSSDGDEVADYAQFGITEHSDVVVCCAVSSHCKYVATGCVDGSVYVWDASSAERRLSLLGRVRLHADAVISLVFSDDCSQLFSCGVDGSSFISTVDKPGRLQYEFENLRQSIRTGNALATTPLEDIVVTDDRSWLEIREVQLIENLKESYQEKSNEVRAAVADIKFHLKVLLERNAARSELEQLNRSEFVIDVKRRNDTQAASVATAQQIREMYTLKLFWNELSAARARVACWDSMDSHSRSILPFVPNSCGDVKSVSSFSVPKLSESEQLTLEKVKRLRAIEVRSQRHHGHGSLHRLPGGKIKACWYTSTLGSSPNISWMLNDGFRWPCTDVVDMITQRDIAAADVGKDKEKGDKKEGAPPAADAAAADDEDEKSLSSLDNPNFEFDDADIFNLLYPPQAIRTQVQKRTYVILLKEIIRINKKKFNDYFERLAREKDDVFASVTSRNDRIETILKELNQSEELLRPKRADIEVSGSAIIVTDQEIASRPYETESMRQQRLKEEEDKRRRDEENDKDDVLGRALEDMMHGTLEVKRDVFAEASAMQRPAWMDDLPPASMDETQLKEYEAFEAKFKALQEEQAAYRKQLELELKKLKAEVIEACKMFDEKLVSLARMKVLTQREVLAQELYIARIAHNVVTGEQAWRNLKGLEGVIDKTRRERGELRGKTDRLAAQCEEIKSKLNIIQEDERSMDKTFKRDIQALCGATYDQDTLKVLNQLFRIRSYAHEDGDASTDNGANGAAEGANAESNAKGGTKGSKVSGSRGTKGGRSNQTSGNAKKSQTGSKAVPGSKLKASKAGLSSANAGGAKSHLGPMQEAAQALNNVDAPSYADKDPFFLTILQQERSKRSTQIPLPLQIPLSMDSDCPEGFNVSQFTWSKLQELRNARIDKEIEGKTMAMKYNDVKSKLDALHAEESTFVNSINTLRSSRDETGENLKRLESDLEVVVNLRQGQDEIDKDSIVTDYSGAGLMSTRVLNKFNSRIKELGKEKIGILSKIKHFRRKINLVDWEARHLSLESNHFEEYFTDLQLFRVTRKLQQVIRDGADAEQAKERLDKVASRKEFMQKDADAKMQKMKKLKELLRKQFLERSEENGTLEKRIRDLKAQVMARKSVRQSRDDARGSAGDSAGLLSRKMKKVVMRRHLVDTARAQAEEIDFLRQELDKIRQKTFPSFIRAVKKRLPNPDER